MTGYICQECGKEMAFDDLGDRMYVKKGGIMKHEWFCKACSATDQVKAKFKRYRKQRPQGRHR